MNRSILPSLAICAAAIAFFFPVLTGKGTFLALDILGRYLPWSTVDGFTAPQNRMIIDPVLGYYPPYFYPSQVYFQQAIKSGIMPLWFAANFCGTPFILFSSPIPFVLFSLLPLTVAHDLVLFVHLAGTGLLMFAYLRKLKMHSIAAAVGAVCWMFNGYVMVWFEFEHVPMMAAALPAALLAMEVWFEKRSVSVFLAMAAAFAMTLSISYAHLIIYQTIFYGVYFLALLLRHLKTRPGKGRRTIGFTAGVAIAMILAMAVSANFFTGHLMLLKEGQRKPYGYEKIFEKSGKLQPERLTTLLFPDLFGNPTQGVTATPRPPTVRVYNNYNELCIYPGVLCLFLAVAGAVQVGRRRYAAFYLGTAVIVVAMAMGSILFYPLWRFVPGLNLSTPTRVLYLLGFALSVLAALGADSLLSGVVKRRGVTGGLWLAIIVCALAIAAAAQTDAGVRWISSTEGLSAPNHLITQLKPYFAFGRGVVARPLLLTAASAAILFAVLAASRQRLRSWLLVAGGLVLFIDLAGFGLAYNTVSPRSMAFPETPGIGFLLKDKGRYRIMAASSFPVNAFVSFGIEDVAGYASVYSRRYGEYIYLSQYGQQAKIPEQLSRRMVLNQAGSPLLDVINTKYLLAPASQPTALTGFSLVYDGEIKIFENRGAFDRVFFVARHRVARTPEEALSLIRTFSRKDFANSVILEPTASHPVPPEASASPPAPADAGIEIVSWNMGRIELDVTSSTDGFVVVGDNYHPGWKATVDGEKSAIFRANYIMRAVAVKKGRHRIEMMFRPKMAIAGIYATLAGWPLLLLYWGAVLLKEKKQGKGGTFLE